MAEDLKAEVVKDKEITADLQERLTLAAERIRAAQVLVVHFGAGMSADSGLPIYKDIATHPAYAEYGLTYPDLCDPKWLQEDPEIFYGFWGDCFNKYRQTRPHEGYGIIKKWRDERFSETSEAAQNFLNGQSAAFCVLSSNVDGHAQQAGIPDKEVSEIHGTIEWWQCSEQCESKVWPAPEKFVFDVDLKTMKAKNKSVESGVKGWESNHPTCIYCGKLARPAILMFGDRFWVDPREFKEYPSYNFLGKFRGVNSVVVEIGAGTNVPTIRWSTEREASRETTTLIRINPYEPHFASKAMTGRTISIEMSGLQALREIDKILSQ